MTTKRQSNAPRHEMREQMIPRITEFIEAKGIVTNKMLCAEFDIKPSTAGSYLRHLHRDLRIIRKGRRPGVGNQEWELGEDLNLPKCDDDERAARTVPACQIGMFRHWMDVALFGPAGGEVAAC